MSGYWKCWCSSEFSDVARGISAEDGVSIINYRNRLDGSLFNLRRLQAPPGTSPPSTKTATEYIFDLRYADDAALASHTSEGLQRNLTTVTEVSQRARLVVNTKKTKVTSHNSYQQNGPHTPFTIAGYAINKVSQFTYLGSILSHWRLWHFNRVTTPYQTRLIVSFWPALSSCFLQPKSHHSYKRCSLQCHLRFNSVVWVWSVGAIPSSHQSSWSLPHSMFAGNSRSTLVAQSHTYISRFVAEPTAAPCSAQLCRDSCDGLVTSSNRLPRRVLYGQLTHGERLRGAPKKRFSDHLKAIPKKCHISFDQLKVLAMDRITWRHACQVGLLNANRQTWHRYSQSPSARYLAHQWILDQKVKGEGHRVTKCITLIITLMMMMIIIIIIIIII